MRTRHFRQSVSKWSLKASAPAAMTLFLALVWPATPQPMPNQVVIQAGTRVVLVNVVVKDKQGKPVDDLSRDDFVLMDNGQEQKITHFAREGAGESATAAPNSPSPLTFTNRPGPGTSPVTVFLFDELNTNLADQQLAKKHFLRYLQGLPASSRVAVFTLGDSLSMLHDFSQDMASLQSAVARHSNRVNPEVQASAASAPSAHSLTGDQANTAQWDDFLKSSNQQYVDYAETVRATRTAAVLETIAEHLQGVPGRKTLIWISGGFPIQLGLRNIVDSIPQANPDARQSSASSGQNRQGGGKGTVVAAGGKSMGKSAGGNQSAMPASTASTELPGTGRSFEDDVARAIRALNEADVSVYPVDARGVTVAGPFQADRSSIGKKGKLAKLS